MIDEKTFTERMLEYQIATIRPFVKAAIETEVNEFARQLRAQTKSKDRDMLIAFAHDVQELLDALCEAEPSTKVADLMSSLSDSIVAVVKDKT